MSILKLPRPNLTVVPHIVRHVPASSVLAVAVGLYVAAGISLLGGGGIKAAAKPTLQPIAQGSPAALPAPESDPAALVPISAEDALVRNAAIPVAEGPNPAARAFTLPADEVARMRSVDCLTAAVYYEAANEPDSGQKAVAQVVLNRVRHPHYPNTVCGVVFQGHMRSTGCQFTFTCDGSLRRTPMAHLWARARKVAEEALAGYVHAPVGWATHYHANYVLPYWAPSLAKVGTIGAHIFYRWDGGWGRPGAFAARYAGVEPDIRWRGGFGQVPKAEGEELVVTAEERDAAAAEAAEKAKGEAHSVDSFQRAVLRRYEPVNKETADRMLEDRAARRPSTSSNRWALTGGSTDQKPLGRREASDGPEQPRVLEGVRRRPGTEAPPAGGSETTGSSAGSTGARQP